MAAAVVWKLVPYRYVSGCCRIRTSVVSLYWCDRSVLMTAVMSGLL